jgi:hypothetical protein
MKIKIVSIFVQEQKKKRSSSISFLFFSLVISFFSSSYQRHFINSFLFAKTETYIHIKNLCIFRYIHKCFHFYNTTLTTFLFYITKSIRLSNFNLVSKCIIIDLYSRSIKNAQLENELSKK